MIALRLAALLIAVASISPSFAVTLPFQTTFNCAESHGYSATYGTGWQSGMNCDGMTGSLGSTCSPGDHPSWVISEANMPTGGGGRGLKVFVGGPNRNNGSGGIAIPLDATVQEFWIRLYMKYPLGMRSTIGGEDWGHKILWITGPPNLATILEPDPDGIKIWNQGQSSEIVKNTSWTWNQIWGHATPGSNLTADGLWHLWEMRVKYNDGSNNGIQQVWVDNVLRLDASNLNITTGGANHIRVHVNQAGVEGGVCVPIYFDDIAVSTTGRIGPLESTTYTVTPSSGANGSISPNTAQTVNSGSTTAFTVTPAGGYTASVGGTCGGSLVGTTYTTNAIVADCTVSATFLDVMLSVLSGLSPTGDQATPGTSIALALTTDENATCRYDLNGVSDYDLMSNYTTTGGTSHSATVTVRKGGVYEPTAKCRDAAGNTSASPAWRFAIPDDPKRRVLH